MQRLTETIQSILRNRRRTALTLNETVRRRAAVLIPLFEKNSQVHVLLGRRSGSLAHHKHQISFPGGLFDDDDASIEETALRETFEEVGVEQGDVKILGQLDDYYTITNFLVTPLVGIIPYPYEFKMSQREVAYLIEAPLPHLLEPRNQRVEYRERPDGSRRELYFYDYHGEVIWGVTAAMLRQFLEVIKPHAARLGFRSANASS